MLRRLLTLLLLALPLLPAVVRADDTPPSWYQVEVIVFRDTSPNANGEVWPADPGTPDESSAVTPDPAGTPFLGIDKVQFLDAPKGADKLDGAVEHLHRSGSFQVLGHLAWRQPGLDKNAKPVLIQVTTDDGAKVDGTIKLVHSRFLHLDLDLLYSPVQSAASASGGSGGAPVVDASSGARALLGSGLDAMSAGAATPTPPAQPTAYRMIQSRRVDSDKLNYFDHPMFGVLAVVTPWEPPKPKPKPAPKPTPNTSAPPQPAAANKPAAGAIQR